MILSYLEAGLGLGANAWKGLAYLGITEDLEMKCNIIENTKFLDQKGHVISNMWMEGLKKKYDVAPFTVHRVVDYVCLKLKRLSICLGG